MHALYSVFPSRIGHNFSYEGPGGAGRGWRLTHRGAKTAGRRAAESVRDRKQPSAYKPSRRRWSHERRRTVIRAAVIVVAVALVGGFVLVRRDRGVPVVATATATAQITVSNQLQNLVTGLVAGFGEENPQLALNVSYVPSTQIVTMVNEGKAGDMVLERSNVGDQFQPKANRAAVIAELGRDPLEIVVGAGAEDEIRGVGDLTPQTRKIGVCDPNTKTGSAAARALLAKGVNTVGFEVATTPKELLDRLALGTLDAAVMYRTDRTSNPMLKVVPMPADADGSVLYNTYTFGTNPAAVRFAEYLAASPSAASILAQAGLRDRTTTATTPPTRPRSRPLGAPEDPAATALPSVPATAPVAPSPG